MALSLHPDKNKAKGAEDAFKKVSQAFGVLSNADKRKNYDLGYTTEDSPTPSPFMRRGSNTNFDMNDLTPEGCLQFYF